MLLGSFRKFTPLKYSFLPEITVADVDEEISFDSESGSIGLKFVPLSIGAPTDLLPVLIFRRSLNLIFENCGISWTSFRLKHKSNRTLRWMLSLDNISVNRLLVYAWS